VRRRSWLSADLLVAGSIALGTLALLVWGGGRLMASLRSAPTPAELSSAFLIPTPTFTPTATREARLPAFAPVSNRNDNAHPAPLNPARRA
jgi:hypothetical protein